MLISFKWAAVKWRFIDEATQKGSEVEEESETDLLAYLGFKALDKKEAVPLWSCVGTTTFPMFYCCCRKQILWNPQKATPFWSKRKRGAPFSECLEMPEARLQGSHWQWRSQVPPASTPISRSWLLGCHVGPLVQAHEPLADFHELMISVILSVHSQKGEGWFVC